MVEKKMAAPTGKVYAALIDPKWLEARCLALGYNALKVMEKQLERTPYLVGEHYSIADIALYAYTHVAHEGGFSLEAFPAVRAWLDRVASHPRHVTMLG